MELIFPLIPDAEDYRVSVGTALSICLGFVSCFVSRPMIVRSTAVTGGSLIAMGILFMAGEFRFLYEAGGPYFLYIGLTALFAATGIYFQNRMKYHLSTDEKNAELAQNLNAYAQ